MQQQSAGRRAWGAPPPPKPAAERRAAGDGTSPPPTQTAPTAAQPQLVRQQSQHKAPGKSWLPKLSVGASPRGAAAVLQGRSWAQLQQQQGERQAAPSRLKQPIAAGNHPSVLSSTLNQGPERPAQAPATTLSPQPQPLPAISPEQLPLAPAGKEEMPWRRSGLDSGEAGGMEEEDMVLIGSASPSFTRPIALSASAAKPIEPTTQQAAFSAAEPQPASLRGAHVGSADLPLAALASSRRGSRYSTASSSLDSASLGSPPAREAVDGGLEAAARGAAAPAAATESYPSDFEPESPCSSSSPDHAFSRLGSQPAQAAFSPAVAGSAAACTQQRAVRLNGSDMAVLRASMLELQVFGKNGHLSGPDSHGVCAAETVPDCLGDGELEIPDQLVLQELSSRLSRLDSQKRRVLLEVLSKLDLSPGGGENAVGEGCFPAGQLAEAETAAEQLIAASSGSSSRRTSVAGSAAGIAPASADSSASTAGQRVPSASGSTHASCLLANEGNSSALAGAQGRGAGTSSSSSDSESQQVSPAAAAAPGKGLMSKLAALRKGRSSSLLGRPGGDGRDSSLDASAASAAEPPHTLQPIEQAPAAVVSHSMPEVPSATLSGSSPAATSDHAVSAVRPAPAVPLASAGHKLQGMARQRDRSRLSVDVRQTAQQAQQAVAGKQEGLVSLLMEQGPPDSQSIGTGTATAVPGDDALSAFEQLHSEDEGQPSLASSPTVLALGAWQLLPDTVDAAVDQAPGRSSAAQSLAASPSGTGSGGGFLIPQCPSGRMLELRISSTWGDNHYVGLAGIELFDRHGQALTLTHPKRQVSAAPHSINVLPEYSSDPRTPDKLLDGICMTCDDAHVWLAPFTRGALHTVTITLDSPASLGAVRVWNYNKSRIHSLRGARRVELALNDSLIFRGELRQAPGNVPEAYKHAELILFTEDPAALEAIEQYDARYARQLAASPGAHGSGSDSAAGEAGEQLDLVTGGITPLSPLSTQGPLERTATLCLLPEGGPPPGRQLLVSGGRPLTAAFSGTLAERPAAAPAAPGAAVGPRAPLLERQGSLGTTSRASSCGGQSANSNSNSSLLHCQALTLVILDTWGDGHFVGLSGLQVLGADGQPLPLDASRVSADPPDLNVFPGHSGDVRTADKLVDGTSNTMDDTHMWLAPVMRQLSAAVVASCQRLRHSVDRSLLPEAVSPYNLLLVGLEAAGPVTGLRVWNYNKSPADTARGVKRMIVLADGVEVSPPGGVLLRRAPGTAEFDFGQLIPLNTCWQTAGARAASRQRAATTSRSARGGPQAGTLTAAGGRMKRQTQQGHQAEQQQQQQLAVQNETVAWACNMPDPAAALDFLQRAAVALKAAGPAGPLLQQPGENFCTPLPCGFSLRLVLLTTWGCPHYVGLSGLEVRDAVRGPLRLRPSQVYAVPASVAMLPGMAADVRTPDKLVNGVVSGAAQHSWLAPLDPVQGNSILIVLDAPLLLGSIRVWNYGKTPSRGVQELECYLDEQLVWKGLLQRAPESLDGKDDFSQVLCFSDDALQEAAAASRRRAVLRRPQGGLASGRQPTAGSKGGVAPGAEGVEEWCQRQEAVVLVNQGQFVAFPPDGGSTRTARPVTAVTVA
ncbi:hypothetical protein D9Q98_001349 [Chlorella vulgaris]|uniref:KATNIP domain-containing protein n=1 Tax=Chlorella vulgaris TaxID=3077 RepID=A0A9D4TZY4_CHLVU|nr:hypothetical protein D9Q98_001349 [Chlorella vulgaris]